jgi:hypothetical protein
MEKFNLDVDKKTKVRIESIGGDLRISGRSGSKLEAQAPDYGELKVVQDEDNISISARSAVLVFLPASIPVAVERVGGDVHAKGLSESLAVESVGGDLRLKRIGRTEIQWIGGDLTARKMDSDLVVAQVGGDAVIEKVEGAVRCNAIGGDLVLRAVQGAVDVTVGGDASVEIVPQKEAASRVVTGSDLTCYLPEESSANVQVNAGGELVLVEPGEFEEAEEGVVFRLGDGQGDVDLTSGGDLWLRVGKYESFSTEDWIDDITNRAEASAAEMEARVGAIVGGAFAFDADRIAERVRKSVSKARRKAERAQKRAGTYGASDGKNVRISFGKYGSKSAEVSDEERMTILRMVEDGKINVEEAEKLLGALEGEA